jgi:hypothetical protein
MTYSLASAQAPDYAAHAIIAAFDLRTDFEMWSRSQIGIIEMNTQVPWLNSLYIHFCFLTEI